jgi:integrase
MPKDAVARWVKIPHGCIEPLKRHVWNMELEAELKGWTREQRRLVFPNEQGRVVRDSSFFKCIWRPILEASKLPYRKSHALRHTYAALTLGTGTRIYILQQLMGHASIEETIATYGHWERADYEASIDTLAAFLKPESER